MSTDKKKPYLNENGERISAYQYDILKNDKFPVRLAKGKKTEIEEHIVNTGDKSLNGFIIRAIDETIERDNKKGE